MLWLFPIIALLRIGISDSDQFGRVTFDGRPFAEGRFRYAYLGIVVKEPQIGKKVVVKKWKYSHIYEYDYWDTDINTYKVAHELVDGWNKLHKINKQYVLKVPEKKKCIKSAYRGEEVDDIDYVLLDEYVIVEEYIDGNWTKWNSNAGYVNDPSRSIQAFSHWTYHVSNGQYIMIDAQGARKGKKYYITDPCIVSNTTYGGKYGVTDLGELGIAAFFKTHQCNEFCHKNWLKPSLDTIYAINTSVLDDTMTGTTYTFEIPHLREYHSTHRHDQHQVPDTITNNDDIPDTMPRDEL